MLIGLGEIAAWILEAIGLTSAVLTIANTIRDALGTSSNGTTIFQRLQGIADGVFAVAQDTAAIRAAVDLIATNQTTGYNDIIAAIAALPDGTSPVVLPSPPAGYGGPTVGAISSDVWSYVLGQGEDAGSALDDLYGSRASLFSNTFATLPGFPWMVAYSLNGWQNYGESNIHPPAHLDALTILPSDASILAWANRAHPGTGGWTNTSFRGTTVPMQLDDNRSDVKWVITMTPAEFAAFQAVPVVVRTAPVWPGLAGKTWGTPVALADQLTITAAMDGIAIAIDSTPARLSFWQFDDLRSYRNLGAISFFTDNGDQEAAQTMGFDEAIYTPKTMVRAAGVKIRLTGGVTGTIYPWTITP